MKASVTWKERMQFLGQSSGQEINLDARAPLGESKGPSPKEMVAMGIAGCTAMDVIALMRKHKQNVQSFRVDCEAETTQGVHPTVFKTILVKFDISGEIDPAKLIEAVTLSQTKYCGVSAMIAKTAPIKYVITLNGNEIAQGQSDFG